MYFEGCIYMETLRDRIRTLAKTKGLSLPKLEAELGFRSGTIVKWEKASPSADKLQKVADYFDVSVDYLLAVQIVIQCQHICGRAFAGHLQGIPKKQKSPHQGAYFIIKT